MLEVVGDLQWPAPFELGEYCRDDFCRLTNPRDILHTEELRDILVG